MGLIFLVLAAEFLPSPAGNTSLVLAHNIFALPASHQLLARHSVSLSVLVTGYLIVISVVCPVVISTSCIVASSLHIFILILILTVILGN